MSLPILLPIEYAAHRNAVKTIIASIASASASERGEAAAFKILEIETKEGSRFLIIDDSPYIFTGFGKKLLPLDHKDQRWAAHMAMVYGLNTKDNEVTPKITNLLGSHALWLGNRMEPRRWTAFVGGKLYLSRYDGTTMCLSGAGIEEDARGFLVDDGWKSRRATRPISFSIEDNGTHVVFADDDNGSVVRTPKIGRNGKLFRLLQGVAWSHSTAGKMKPRHQVQALMIWMMAVAFPDLFPTKPILMLEGAPGSGKSTLIQMIQQALFGVVEPFTVSEDGLRDFWITLLRSPIMVLDNTDEFIKWLPDQICAYTTRGCRTERRLHTNTGKVEIRPQSFIAVASKDPKSFRREDTADRTIVLRMESRFTNGGGGGLSGRDIVARVEQARAEMYGEWLYYLNRVVAALRLEPPRQTSTRLGDFELFAYAACRAFGWQSTVIVPELMKALASERTAFASETDIVLDTIRDWMGHQGNVGREVSARALHRELASVAELNNKPFVKTVQALTQRLRAPHVRQSIAIYESQTGDDKNYTIYPNVPSEEQN